MGFKRNQSISVFFFVIMIIMVSAKDWRVQEPFYHIYYILTQGNQRVNDKDELDKLLASFKLIEYKDLIEEYKSYTKTESANYKNLLKNKSYYGIRRKDIFKNIVGPIKVRELVSKDKYYRASIKDGSKEYMWLISKELLLKLFNLRKALEQDGYNPNAMTITNGHKHPK